MSKRRSTSIETKRSRLASERPPKKGVATKNAFRSGELTAIALEVRLVCSRDMRVLVRKEVSVIFVLHILGADTFLPFCHILAAIGNRRRPWHGEDAGILHREFELQAFAPVIGIDKDSDGSPFLC